ncbi:TetR/AcrR family transcriptional regulator [Rhizobium pusense]|uniref:TetR/AcrR family transcriptional regulator n=1 Tax=Agrobacterium pusense TaxID=648995 RepID=UPI001FCD0AD9|nr:TetR/AcrR family transcriptional regulator [Agrobacterium pusense]MCJ2877399.1 TetR/AcrR family transcriptional regulator [Agrobacterium pusense]
MDIKDKAAKKAAKPASRGRGRPKGTSVAQDVAPRERLIAAAIPLFALHGYETVSTGQIAAAADLSQPMVHYHFKSKDRIWYEAIETLMYNLARQFPNRRDELKDLDPVARLKVLTRRFILMSASDTTLSRIILHESLVQSERLAWLVERFVSKGFRDFDEAIRQGVDAGRIKPLPAYTISNTIITASSFTFCLVGLVKLVYDKNITDPAHIQEMADSIVEILFHGIVRNV